MVRDTVKIFGGRSRPLHGRRIDEIPPRLPSLAMQSKRVRASFGYSESRILGYPMWWSLGSGLLQYANYTGSRLLRHQLLTSQSDNLAAVCFKGDSQYLADSDQVPEYVLSNWSSPISHLYIATSFSFSLIPLRDYS
jgi:hypothetical protein